MLSPVTPVRWPVVAAAAAGLLLVSCQRDATPDAPAPSEPSAPAAQTQVTPPINPALDRRELLGAVATATSSYAEGGAPTSGSVPVGAPPSA